MSSSLSTSCSLAESTLLNTLGLPLTYGFTQKPHSFGGMADASNPVEASKQQLLQHLKQQNPDFSGQLFIPQQCHGGHVKQVPAGDLSSTDALVTLEKNVAIGVLTADCVPIVLLDPVANVIAVAHAGWKGTQQQIVKSTVQKMMEWGNSPAEDILAVIGPAISQPVFQVSVEVVEALKPTVTEQHWPALFLPDTKATEPNKWLVDLKGINQHQLLDAGLKSINIEQLPECTVLNNQYYHSHRKGDIGRQLAFIMLRD